MYRGSRRHREDSHPPGCESVGAGSHKTTAVPGAAPARTVRLTGMTQRRPPGAATPAARPRWRLAGWEGRARKERRRTCRRCELVARGAIQRRSVNRSDRRPQVPTPVRRDGRPPKRRFILPIHRMDALDNLVAETAPVAGGSQHGHRSPSVCHGSKSASSLFPEHRVALICHQSGRSYVFAFIYLCQALDRQEWQVHGIVTRDLTGMPRWGVR